jgi:hypothetical protein
MNHYGYWRIPGRHIGLILLSDLASASLLSQLGRTEWDAAPREANYAANLRSASHSLKCQSASTASGHFPCNIYKSTVGLHRVKSNAVQSGPAQTIQIQPSSLHIISDPLLQYPSPSSVLPFVHVEGTPISPPSFSLNHHATFTSLPLKFKILTRDNNPI